nr:MAG TPA: hypothetical protein [Caudoviricetes sp.]
MSASHYAIFISPFIFLTNRVLLLNYIAPSNGIV